VTAKLTSKSITYGARVVQRIIGAKVGAARKAPRRPAPAPKPAVPLPPRQKAAAPAAASAEAPAVQHLRVGEDGAGQRLDNYLVKTLKGVPKTHVYRIIRSGEVRVNRGRAAADTRLALGDELRLPPVRVAEKRDDAPAPPREFPVVYEDEQLLAIDKPAGVAVHGGSGVSFGVIEQLRRARPTAGFLELVHRLDRETSGLLLIAKKRSALTALQQQFRARETGKTYAALVPGAWPARLKVIDVPLHKYLDAAGERRVRAAGEDDDGQRSITLVKVAEALGGHTLLDVTIKTGRTHQIRVHLAQAGHAIVGDDKYGDFALNKRLARGETVPGLKFDRMFLHARTLRFEHPASGETLELHAPLPPECRALVDALRQQTTA
jgi:23S rRNA pseudouridine955/2504/2580 synthase